MPGAECNSVGSEVTGFVKGKSSYRCLLVVAAVL